MDSPRNLTTRTRESATTERMVKQTSDPVKPVIAVAKRSPEYVQISTAAAMTLELLPGKMYRTACTHCLNILLTYPEGCRANCSYCGLARHREESRDYAARNFIRVEWPTVPYRQLLEQVANGLDRGQFQRMCISMITHPDSDADTFQLLQQWMAALPHIPVSILSNPTSLAYVDLLRLRELGAEIFTVALDAVTPAIFERTRGKTVASPHCWEHYWRIIHAAAQIFGAERFGAHLICGLGETEQEILTVAQQIKDLGGHNHMFAFFPERGSLMQDWPAVPLPQWRRVQLGRYLIDYRGQRVEQMSFDNQGRLRQFGLAAADVAGLIREGVAFQTSGCPGNSAEVSACNRPFGDSRPSAIRSFPFPLAMDDLCQVEAEIFQYD